MGLATFHVHPDDVPFARLERPWGTTLMKLLRVSVTENSFTNIIRWPAGTQLPTHLHTGAVDAWTFEGRWRYLEYDWAASAGDYVHEPPGTVHTLLAEEDTLALFSSYGGFLWYGPNGELAKYQDAASTLADVQAALALDGLTLPPGVID
jgi:hypothetical protein